MFNIRGGQSTLEQITMSAMLSSLCPMLAATTVIIDNLASESDVTVLF